MEVVRPIAIFIEVLLLAVITYTVLAGMRLTLFDLGISSSKYGKAITMALMIVFVIVVVFFTAHLANFYPPREGY